MRESDATYKWAAEVNNSVDEAASLHHEISDLSHRLDDLVHTLRDLGTVRFEDVEDYEVLEKARNLWELASKGVSGVRHTMQNAANEIYDLRRAD